MNEYNLHSNFSVKDIHNYLSGNMSSAEMHAIEKAALDDSLLAEAIDGYALSKDFTTPNGYQNIEIQINDLKNKFNNPSSKPAPIVPLIKKNNFIKAAAVLLLISMAALAFYFTNYIKNDSAKNIAEVIPQNNTPIITSVDSSSVTNEKSVSSEGATVKVDTKKEPSPTIIAPKNQEIPKLNDANKIESSNESASKVIENIPSSADQSVAINSKIKNEKPVEIFEDKKDAAVGIARAAAPAAAYDQEKTEKSPMAKKAKTATTSLMGKVVNKNDVAIPYVKIVTNQNQISTTDKDGLFNLGNSTNTSTISFIAKNYCSKTVQATDGFKKIVLEEKKIKQKKIGINNPSRVVVLYSSGASPKEGWPKYLQFLIDKLSYSEYDTGKPVVGESIVSFDINADNTPINFNFEKQIDSDVNAAIEDLILFGPRWSVSENTALLGHIKLKINF